MNPTPWCVKVCLCLLYKINSVCACLCVCPSQRQTTIHTAAHSSGVDSSSFVFLPLFVKIFPLFFKSVIRTLPFRKRLTAKERVGGKRTLLLPFTVLRRGSKIGQGNIIFFGLCCDSSCLWGGRSNNASIFFFRRRGAQTGNDGRTLSAACDFSA